MVLYNTAIITTCAIKVTSQCKIHQELGLGLLANRRWSRKLLFFHKIVTGLLPAYLHESRNSCNDERTYSTRFLNQKKTITFSGKAKKFKSFLFHTVLKNWGRTLQVDSINKSKSSCLNFMRPRENTFFAIHDINGVKVLICLAL